MWALLLACAAVPSSPLADLSLAVVPPYIEAPARHGSTIREALAFTNQGSDTVLVSVDFVDFGVDENGDVVNLPPGSGTASLLKNISISPLVARVAPREKVYFRYRVEVPEAFSQLRTMIYFSSRVETPPGPNEVQMVARMGVPLYVESLQAEPALLEVEEVRWERDESRPDALRLLLTVTNSGQRNLRPEGWVRVTTTDGSVEDFVFNQGREPVLPGQKRRWEQHFGPVPEGEMHVKLHMATSTRSVFESGAVVPAAGR